MRKLLVIILFLVSISVHAQLRENITKYLPKNFVRNGKIDYTSYIQTAINKESNVVFPNFPLAVNYNGLNLRSNTKITFQKASKLIMLPNNKQSYKLINIEGVSNIEIISPTLVGDRYNHLGNSGEWGMGIKIMSANNIRITNVDISNFWGDGIYVGRLDGGLPYSTNVYILGGEISNNRRNGISIVSARTLLLKDLIISNTNGINPMAGIDLEPNATDEFLSDIDIKNVKTIKSKVDGIKLVLHKFNKRNNVSISIDGHTDIDSPNPLTIVGNDTNNMNLIGSVSYKNANWNNIKSNIRVQRKLAPNLNFKFDQVNINGTQVFKGLK
ncbi:MAG: hypothetical protein LBV59_26350 [Sphingobacterium sp.]|jgi:hypothetical protein|uniref:hypothetical protein n=1 Tax=Sphingobacterium sp. TaxID=341027 RepID=UPI0028477403|nr:hypothetical protein [Sphingobacterium sp.]MDR3011470.1 hypothetical protein [Sphingobacterium sp.]